MNATDARAPTRLTLRLALTLALGLAGLGVGVAWGLRAWSFHADLDRAERALAARRYDEARGLLAVLARRRPGNDEVEYSLGVSEAALGHVGAALEAWGRVPAGAPLAPRAALERARLALEHGRLAAAEESLARVVDAPGPDGDEASRLARQLDLYSGRADRINRRIERRWRLAPDQAAQLRAHWLVDTQASPVEAVRAALDRFGREAPDDHLVWLGRADLATRTGRYAEADELLSACEARRPTHPDVAEARLRWALDAGRPAEAARALARLPADRFRPADLAAVEARLAALRGDAPAERAALLKRVAREPGDSAAWGRLADLAARDGSAGAELRARARARKAEIDRSTDAYRKLMGEVTLGELPPALAADLARTAESLGRRFEARGWWTLRARQDPTDREARAALARLERRDPPDPTASPDPGRTAADLLGLTTSGASAALPPAPGPANAVPTFRDDAAAAGLRFVYDNDQTPRRRLPETMGGGLALLDYDGDGFLDVYAVQGGRFPPPPGGREPNGDKLFRNKGGGTFEDVSGRSGIAAFRRGFGHGVAVGDVDNDGFPDLFVTRWRGYALYRNKGDGTFEDRTDRAGLGGERGWPTSAAFADLDGDGDLDLYVCHYLRWDPDLSPPCPDPDRPGRNVYCVPRAFEAEPDHVFRNDGGRFVDVTKEAGVVDRDGRGLGVVAADLDGDGRVDLYVANDMTANFLFRNLGGFRFEEVGESSGAGSSAGGGYQAGMGIACGDLDGDGQPDLAVTNFYGESVSFYKNLGGGLFADRTTAAGLAAPTRYVLGFGASFLDADNDGRLDLAVANGHVNDYSPAIPYAMPAQLFLGARGGRLVDATDRAGACWSEPRVGRGLAAGDLDNDGRTDVLLLAQNGPLAWFHNLGPAGHSVTLRLEGTASNRDAVGARVRLTAPGAPQTAWRIGGGSFLSAGDGRVRFGLGAATAGRVPAVTVEVHWPSGRVDRHEGLAADAGHHLVEGDPRARPLKGWRGPP